MSAKKMRVTALSRRGRRNTGIEGQTSLSKTARATYDAMIPTDVVIQHEWLFRQCWVEESADELFEVEIDFQAREKRIKKHRTKAITINNNVWIGTAAIILQASRSETTPSSQQALSSVITYRPLPWSPVCQCA